MRSVLCDKGLATLRKLQAEHAKARAQAFSEAKNLAQLNYARDRIYDPAFDFPPEKGIVFTSAEINAGIRRDRRLKEAERDARSDFDPTKKCRPFDLNVIDLPPGYRTVTIDELNCGTEPPGA